LITKQILAVTVTILLLYLTLLVIVGNRKANHIRGVMHEREHLQERNRLLLAAMEMAPNGILVCNRDGKLLYANRRLAEMHGIRDPQLLIGRYAAELRGGRRNDHIYHEITAAVDEGGSWSGEYILNSDQESPTVVVRTMSGVTLDGYLYLVGIDRDVTEERVRATRLESAQRLESLGVLAGGIAHDFNNILTAIRGNTVLAQRNCRASNTAYLQRIEEGTERAADLCQQMLAYAGKGQSVIEPLNLSTLVDEISKLITISIDQRVTLNIKLAERLPPVEGDRSQLQQIILNLITNANEAIIEQPSWSEGSITVVTSLCEISAGELARSLCDTTLQPGECVALDVYDNGCGMDRQIVERMFEPFFTTKFTGRGLGMSAVLGIVQSHNGALLVESEPNEGSHFRLLLPPTEMPLVEPDLPEVVEQRPSPSALILIIDDEEVIREMVAELLQDVGLRTIVAEDGARGVELFRQHKVEVAAVLLDMTMPGMDGEVCFQELRAIRDDIPVVISSGYAEQDIYQTFGEDMLAGFLHKPFNPAKLQAMIQKIVIAGRPL
ncbi:MAG: response regulator, partial [Mariprofundales bacterium]|nr:response regulator [Mariprofundales bacterium]